MSVVLLATMLVCAPPLSAQRQRLSMDTGWRFSLGDPQGAEQTNFNDRDWRVLDLPHDWSIEGALDQNAPGGGRIGYFPTGIGWYRKAFRLPEDARGGTVWLEFDGVYMNSDVWVNGHHLGRRPYGYSSFAYDLTQDLAAGTNVIAVRVDNSKQPNSRWYSGSGIYRHTWLTVSNPLHVAHWGTYVTTPTIDSAHAQVSVETHIENRGAATRHALLRSIVLDDRGQEVARADTPFQLNPGDTLALKQQLQVAKPRIWSIDTPALYSLRTVVMDGSRAVDEVTTSFGIRSIAFDKDRGFLLNGQRVKLNGVNLHHDGGAVGAAVPESIWQQRLELLKRMGANAIRTSHNPPAPEFLDLADRMGFVAMAEAFDEWTYGKVEQGYHNYFADWSERDLTDFIQRDRNHPSIVLWSAGNEIGEQAAPNGAQVLRRLVAIFHEQDPTRPVTTGNDHIHADDGAATLNFLNAEDVVGYNYVDRWHERRETFADQDRHDHPEWKMIGTESDVAFNTFTGTYSLGSDAKRVQPNYTTGMIRAERLWKWVATHDYFAGDFMWTGIDYLGETRWPGKGAGTGPIDITGHPKDSYYLYQSQWTDRPVLHLFPHWNWPGREGQLIPVLAYTNCNAVELFLNGKSLGEKRLEFPAQGASGGWNSYARPQVHATTNDLHLQWDVPYEPGVLKAVGTKDGKVTCEAEVRTAGVPAAIRLVANRDTIDADPRDVGLIRFEIIDAQGNVVPTADNAVSFTISGGSVVALDNGDLQDHEPYQSNHRRAFNGRGLVIVRATHAGVLRVSATAAGLKSAQHELTARKGRPVPAVPAVTR